MDGERGGGGSGQEEAHSVNLFFSQRGNCIQ